MRLYNTLTNEKELFEPLRPGRVGIYVCGPTVYKPAHIGHAVGPVIFDALKRYLTYKGYRVTLVLNITDVDDKILAESRERGVAPRELTEGLTRAYFDAIEKLGVTTIDHTPRVSEHIGDVIELIQRLGERGAAYEAGGDVYFDVAACREYGKLSNRSAEEQMAGGRETAGTGKRHEADFALWKASKPDEPMGWDSPWGRGRPGWHIECSVMSMKYLGESFDIHGGGIDLIFPHHENEIAQSETATGRPFAKYWMHNGLTRVRTKAASGEWQNAKMSKSVGNVRGLNELLEAWPGQVIRFFLLSTHYRRPLDFSDEAIESVRKGMAALHRALGRVARITGEDVYGVACSVDRLGALGTDGEREAFREEVVGAQLRYLEALDDDFNTAGGIAVLHELATGINRFMDQRRIETHKDADDRALVLEAARMLSGLGQTIGLLEGPVERAGAGADALAEGLMGLLIQLRQEARAGKNFALADGIRDRLGEMGVVLEDRAEGTVWHRASD